MGKLKSIRIMNEILKKFPKNLILNIQNQKFYYLVNNLDDAQKNIEQVLNISPGNYPASILKQKY